MQLVVYAHAIPYKAPQSTKTEMSEKVIRYKITSMAYLRSSTFVEAN